MFLNFREVLFDSEFLIEDRELNEVKNYVLFLDLS